MNMNLWFELHR